MLGTFNKAEVVDMILNGDHVLWYKYKINNTQSIWYYNFEEDMLWYKRYSDNGDELSSEPAYTQDPYKIFIEKHCELISYDRMLMRIEGVSSVRYV